MPNHIQNRLQVIGTNEQIKEVLDFISSKYDDDEAMQIDFNKIKLMPKDLQFEHFGMHIEDAVKVALKMPMHENQLISHLEEMNRRQMKSPLEYNNDDWGMYIQALNNVRKYGFIYWHDWARENWGTKWNAYSQNDTRNTSDTIYFQTAWSSPINLISKLSEMFPQVTLHLVYADEDSGSNTGRIMFNNGRDIKVFQPESGSEEGYQIYFELHPDDAKYYKLVNGTYEHIDE